MARNGKDINIPKGPQTQSEDIREALMAKVKQQEQLSQVGNVAQQQQPQYQQQQQPQHQQQQQQQQTPPQPQMQTQAQNQYSNYGTYSSPFQNTPTRPQAFTNSPNNLVEAIHSNEPIQYKPKKRKSAIRTFLVLFIMIAVIFTTSWSLREFVFQAYEIPSGSMEKTIMTWDMVFAEKITPFWFGSKKGNVVTFNDPMNDERILIKRVIATEGQTIDIRDDKLYVDGVEQDEPYVNGLPTKPISRSKITYPYTVPEGHVWLMGDNRTNSQDSRYFGAVPQETIIGHALFIYFPFDDIKPLV